MKKITARFVSFAVALMILVSLALPAFASPGNPEFMLAIGDSITTGFGLEGYDELDPYTCNSYTNLIANALSLNGKDTYINKAVNGATSADVLAYLPDIANYLGYADLIVVTVGGNDLQGESTHLQITP